MDEFGAWLEIGIKLGYAGDNLKDFCTKQIAEQIERTEKAQKEKDKKDKAIAAQEIRKLELQKELNDQQIKLASMNANNSSKHGDANPSKFKCKIPYFNEKTEDMGDFLHRFEILAETHAWSDRERASQLQSVLTGRALQVLSSFSAEQAMDYKELKLQLLLAFQCTDDGFRNKFRNAKPERNESFTAFVNRCHLYFRRWIELAGVVNPGESLVELMVIDQIYATGDPRLVSHLKEQKPSTCEELSKIGERFLMAHGDVRICPQGNDAYVFGNVASVTSSDNNYNWF